MFSQHAWQPDTLQTVHPPPWAGWGLDWVWPYLLRYPRDSIAVIDEICMVHPHTVGTKSGEGSVYDVWAPYDAEEEEKRRRVEYHYNPRTLPLGFNF
jgi:hypothetical protein